MKLEQTDIAPDAGWDEDVPPKAMDDLARMRADDIAILESLQSMAMSFASWLHDKGAEQMEIGGDKAADTVRQLSYGFNKAARTVRFIVVLKQEVAGLRPTRHARPAGAANQNQPNQSKPAANRGGKADMRDRVFNYVESLTEEERAEEEAKVEGWVQKLTDALDVDLEASGDPEIIAEAARQSIAIKLTKIASQIAHPNLDRTIVAIELGKLWDMWGPQYSERPDSIAPPNPEWCRPP